MDYAGKTGATPQLIFQASALTPAMGMMLQQNPQLAIDELVKRGVRPPSGTNPRAPHGAPTANPIPDYINAANAGAPLQNPLATRGKRLPVQDLVAPPTPQPPQTASVTIPVLAPPSETQVPVEAPPPAAEAAAVPAPKGAGVAGGGAPQVAPQQDLMKMLTGVGAPEAPNAPQLPQAGSPPSPGQASIRAYSQSSPLADLILALTGGATKGSNYQVNPLYKFIGGR